MLYTCSKLEKQLFELYYFLFYFCIFILPLGKPAQSWLGYIEWINEYTALLCSDQKENCHENFSYITKYSALTCDITNICITGFNTYLICLILAKIIVAQDGLGYFSFKDSV